MFKVDSTNISMVDYDPDNLTLTVYFKDGSVYNYLPIYESQVMDFNTSKSKGSWFNQNIRKNKTISTKKVK
jgi:hypothetical protein